MKDDRRRVSEAQERATAKRFDAKRHKGSGSGARRFDMHTDTELIECKTVLQGNKQITIKDSYLRRFLKDAALQDLSPVLQIRLAGLDWVLIPEADYQELRSY